MKLLDTLKEIVILILIWVSVFGIVFGIVQYPTILGYRHFNKIESFQYTEATAEEMILTVQKIMAKDDFKWIGEAQGITKNLIYRFHEYQLIYNNVQVRATSLRDYKKYVKFIKSVYVERLEKVDMKELLKEYNNK